MLKKITLLFCLIVLALLFSGCTFFDYDKTAVSTVTIVIDETGNITKYDATITMSSTSLIVECHN